MAEYIEREALLKDFRTFMAERFDKEKCVSAENCKDCERKCLWHRVVAKAPAADVAPVVHAKWIDGADAFGAKRGQYRVCSRCNICIPCVSELAAPYWRGCPNCFARMDGE
jgi:hypothetical protein